MYKKKYVANDLGGRSIKSLALITSKAATLINFRGTLIAALVARGIKVYALAPDYDDRIKDQILLMGVQPVEISLDRTGIGPLRDIFDSIRLAHIIGDCKPNAVLSYFVMPVIYGSIAAWLARVPYRFAIVGGLGYIFTDSVDELSRYRLLLRWAVSYLYAIAFVLARKVFFLNNDDANYFVKRGFFNQQKSIQIGGIGVDLGYFYFASPVGINAEIVLQNENGILADTNEQWEIALGRLIEDKKLRDRMGRAGRELVEREYSLQVQASNLADVFLRAVNR